ncbi:Glycosyltransferase KanE [Jannaschia seosinensis]|uniref:Glycosyltransferase KanE n=1 Tax=Jannaschia seosinensis TaxID=313367 RepID=A0A0M7BAA5_9RHOB|nr:glycosyltransferase family 4 protein [Jannaschia seosinensis]CUH38702.1 Glycosyltransferase KanE [Jannaschia seosinensis]
MTDRSFPGSSKIAYLTGAYPAVSHTFILREVEALRALGAEVLTCSIRRTGDEHHRGPSERAAAADTFYVLAAAKQPSILLRALAGALRRPGRTAAAAALAFRMRPPGLRALIYQIFYLVEAMILADYLRKQGVTHLHNHFASSSATVALLTGVLTGIPFSYTLHGPADLFEAHRWRLDLKTARAAFVACISHFARSQAMLFSDPAHWPKLRIVHCGVLPEIYDRPTPPSDATAGLEFLFIGRLAPVKGVRVLLKAFNAARKQVPDLRLTLVGDGTDRTVLESLAASAGDAITFTGYLSQEEVANRLAKADAFVLPSFAEGVPVVLMEAMAGGRPVIATRVAGVAELVDDGESGYLVPPGDAETLAHRMIALARDPDLRRRMGVAGRAKVHAEFDIRIEAARMLSLIEGTSGSDLPPPSR